MAHPSSEYEPSPEQMLRLMIDGALQAAVDDVVEAYGLAASEFRVSIALERAKAAHRTRKEKEQRHHG